MCLVIIGGKTTGDQDKKSTEERCPFEAGDSAIWVTCIALRGPALPGRILSSGSEVLFTWLSFCLRIAKLGLAVTLWSTRNASALRYEWSGPVDRSWQLGADGNVTLGALDQPLLLGCVSVRWQPALLVRRENKAARLVGLESPFFFFFFFCLGFFPR